MLLPTTTALQAVPLHQLPGCTNLYLPLLVIILTIVEPHGGPGGSGMSGVITVENPTSVNDDDITVEDFELKQNYPKPV